MNELGKALLGLGLLLAITGALLLLAVRIGLPFGAAAGRHFFEREELFRLRPSRNIDIDQHCALGPLVCRFALSALIGNVKQSVRAPKRSDAARGRHQRHENTIQGDLQAWPGSLGSKPTAIKDFPGLGFETWELSRNHTDTALEDELQRQLHLARRSLWECAGDHAGSRIGNSRPQAIVSGGYAVHAGPL